MQILSKGYGDDPPWTMETKCCQCFSSLRVEEQDLFRIRGKGQEPFFQCLECGHVERVGPKGEKTLPRLVIDGLMTHEVWRLGQKVYWGAHAGNHR